MPALTGATLLNAAAIFDGIVSSDSDYTRRRAVHRERAQEVIDEFWNWRPWNWRLLPVTLTVASGTTFSLVPVDFVEVGAIGSLLDLNNNGFRLEERSPIEVEHLQQISSSIAMHRIYAVFRTVDTGNFNAIQIGKNGAAQSFKLWYLSASPTLTDVVASPDTSGMHRIPVMYHYPIILAGLKAKIAEANDDPVANQYQQHYIAAIARAVAAEGQGRHSTVQKLPNMLGNRSMW